MIDIEDERDEARKEADRRGQYYKQRDSANLPQTDHYCSGQWWKATELRALRLTIGKATQKGDNE